MKILSRTLSFAAAALLLSACAGEGADEAADTEMPAAESTAPEPSVMITQPADGDTVDGPAVTVGLEVENIQVVMAGDTTPNSGHHHLFLDRDLTPADQPIPTEPGHIVHMGDASSGFTFEDVEPGEHRLIAVMGDALHVPVQPWVTDTVTFVVH